MGRPRKKPFRPGDRVAWQSSNKEKTGTILTEEHTGEEASKVPLPKGYRTAYDTPKKGKEPHYLVAADTPLLKPGYTTHWVALRKLTPEKECWTTLKTKILRLPEHQTRKIALAPATVLHRLKKKTPEPLRATLLAALEP